MDLLVTNIFYNNPLKSRGTITLVAPRVIPNFTWIIDLWSLGVLPVVLGL